MSMVFLTWYMGLMLFALLGINIYHHEETRACQRDEARRLLNIYRKLRLKRRLTRR